MSTVFNKRIAIPLAAYFYARVFDKKAGYGGNIEANGYVGLRNYGAEYDQKSETLFIVFDAERDDQPLTPLGIPAAVADAELVEPKEPKRGELRTPYPRTKPGRDAVSPIVAIPDMAEGTTPQEAEFSPGDSPSKDEFFTLLVLPEDTDVPLFDYNEPLTHFLRDGHRYAVYLEARTAPIGTVEPGTLNAADENLTLTDIIRPEPSAAAKSLVEQVLEEVRRNSRPAVVTAPTVTHLGKAANGLFSQRFDIGLEPLFENAATSRGFEVHGGRIPLRGYRVDGQPTARFDPATEKLVIEFDAERTIEPLSQFKSDKRAYAVPNIADGLSPTDAEYAVGTAPVAYHELAVLVAEYFSETEYTAFSAPARRKPVTTFMKDGKKFFVLLEVQTRSYENGLYDHEVRFPFEEIDTHTDGHMLWTSGHSPVFKQYDEIDPSTVSVRLSSNRKKLVVNVKLRRDGDFDYIKKDIKSDSIRQVKTGSIEARDHGEEPAYGFDASFGYAAFIEITDIGFRLYELKDGETALTAQELEKSEGLDGWGTVYVGTAGGYAVYAFYHED